MRWSHFEYRPASPGCKPGGSADPDRKEIREGLPAAVRKNEGTLRDVLAAEVGKLWRKEDRASREGGPLYRFGIGD